ncbi:MAG: Molybdenum cofactor biosynthesis protein MoaB [Brockia lithotrophica]|uniref:Molybdenum cofactor biosynthesis protein B n=1 Tax=Brockia lithotrophica TaxID=933949 RepID=A0A2T5G7R7_9BACL|nr:MAG: Molybdenum cofactor biosynthesis protein MoaB [Brockia lithotrophica]
MTSESRLPFPDEHAHFGEDIASLSFAVVTVSDTRTPETDRGGRWIRERLEESGHRVVYTRIVPDEVEAIRQALEEALASEAFGVLFTGGSGVTARDVTVEAVLPRLEKVLPGFGELFRMLSFREIHARAMLSRAEAGVVGRKAVFLLPGSLNAVRLAVEELILPVAKHLFFELRRQ